MATYKGARLKIKRADKHISDTELSISKLQTHLLVTANVDAAESYEFIKCDFETPEDRIAFDELSVLIGDAIHNLKCALDHAWLETVKRLIPHGDWERTKFPCFASENELQAALKKLHIDVDAPKLFVLLMGVIKPHGEGDFFVRNIHELDLRDKHRLLIPVAHYSSIGDIVVRDVSGELHRGNTWGTSNPLPHFVQFAKGIHIENSGSASFEAMIQYENSKLETRAVDSLRLFLRSVSIIVEKLEMLGD